MTNKEKAIRKFAKAMRTASREYIVEHMNHKCFTISMELAWYEFCTACQQEINNGRS